MCWIIHKVTVTQKAPRRADKGTNCSGNLKSKIPSNQRQKLLNEALWLDSSLKQKTPLLQLIRIRYYFFKFKWTIQNLIPIKVFPTNFETMLLTIVIKVRNPKNSAIEKLIKRIASDPKMAWNQQQLFNDSFFWSIFELLELSWWWSLKPRRRTSIWRHWFSWIDSIRWQQIERHRFGDRSCYLWVRQGSRKKNRNHSCIWNHKLLWA